MFCCCCTIFTKECFSRNLFSKSPLPLATSLSFEGFEYPAHSSFKVLATLESGGRGNSPLPSRTRSRQSWCSFTVLTPSLFIQTCCMAMLFPWKQSNTTVSQRCILEYSQFIWSISEYREMIWRIPKYWEIIHHVSLPSVQGCKQDKCE